jgi:hypothetical protein
MFTEDMLGQFCNCDFSDEPDRTAVIIMKAGEKTFSLNVVKLTGYSKEPWLPETAYADDAVYMPVKVQYQACGLEVEDPVAVLCGQEYIDAFRCWADICEQKGKEAGIGYLACAEPDTDSGIAAVSERE